MVRKTKEEALETRNLILDTAERIFADKGVSRTSLADVANAAGVTRGAIYWHFKNKVDLFNAMCDRIRLPMETMIEGCTATWGDAAPLKRIHEICTLVLVETARNPHRRRVLDILFHKCEYTDEMNLVRERQQEACAEGRERIEHDLREAVDKGELPADLDTRRSAVLLHAMVCGVMGDWLFMPDSFDIEHEAANMVSGFFDMLRHSPHLRLRQAS